MLHIMLRLGISLVRTTVAFNPWLGHTFDSKYLLIV